MSKVTKPIKSDGKTTFRVNNDKIVIDKLTLTPVASGTFERKKVSYTATAFTNTKKDHLILVFAPVTKSATTKWQAEHEKTRAFWFVQEGALYYLDEEQHEKAPFAALRIEKAVTVGDTTLPPSILLFDKVYRTAL